MSQRESKLSGKIMAALRLEGWFCFKVHGGPTMMAGLPDIVCCAEGIFVGLETKNPESRSHVSPIQEHVHDKIKDAGGVAVVVCSPSEAIAAVRAALKARELQQSRV